MAIQTVTNAIKGHDVPRPEIVRATAYESNGIVSRTVTTHMIRTFLPERIDISVTDTSPVVAPVLPPID